MKQVAIFVATRWERKAVSQACGGIASGEAVSRVCSVSGRPEPWQVWLFQTGIGSENASRSLQQALSQQSFDLIISTGFACALTEAQIGDILIGSLVDDYPDRSDPPKSRMVQTPGTWVDYAYRMGTKAGMACRQGPFVSALTAVGEAQTKQQIAQETGAIGLDMESAALANVARDHQVDCLIVRTVSDLVDEDLPVDFNLFFNGGGQLIWGILTCLVRPACWKGINRLRKQSVLAADRVTTFFQVFFEGATTNSSSDRV